jgi:hypothetical protein
LFRDKRNLKAEMVDVMHTPLGEFVAFYLGGGGKGFSSFQGHFAGVSMRFGPGSVQENANTLRNEIEMYYSYNSGSVKY